MNDQWLWMIFHVPSIRLYTPVEFRRDRTRSGPSGSFPWLTRWIKFDPQGYLDLQAPEVTYFDPFTESRVDGLEAMQVRVAPMKNLTSPPSRIHATR
jgi:hypothetical protein